MHERPSNLFYCSTSDCSCHLSSWASGQSRAVSAPPTRSAPTPLESDDDRRRPSEVATELGWAAVVVLVLDTTTELAS